MTFHFIRIDFGQDISRTRQFDAKHHMLTIWQTQFGDGPLVACAVHDGHAVRAEVAECLRLDENQRRYEEDPYTAEWTSIAPTRIVARRSRFELDLNRPREKAVYITPADAGDWTCGGVARPRTWLSIRSACTTIFTPTCDCCSSGWFRGIGESWSSTCTATIICEVASGESCDDPQLNPEINLGTGSMDRQRWTPMVERWLAEMRSYDYFGRHLDVRENVRFFGGQLPTWIHQQFPTTVCALAIEVKKFFMNEWTGELDTSQHGAIGKALGPRRGRCRRRIGEAPHVSRPTSNSDLSSQAEAALAAFDRGEPVRIELPGGGTLQLERRSPILCVYRRTADRHDVGTEELVTAEKAHMVIPAEPRRANERNKSCVPSSSDSSGTSAASC